jgi:uncharacterized RDD family membrane protein YckC
VAALIDGILISVVLGIISSVFFPPVHVSGKSVNSYGTMVQPVQLLGFVYYVFMVSKYGATLGKKAMHIRVQNAQTGANLTVIEAILREVIGKLVSSIILCLGYFWMLWDPKKQTWHDKIASSVVVKTN